MTCCTASAEWPSAQKQKDILSGLLGVTSGVAAWALIRRVLRRIVKYDEQLSERHTASGTRMESAGIDRFVFPFASAQCGGAFPLNRPARRSAIITPEPGETVEIQQGSEFVSVASEATLAYPALLSHVQSTAQNVLDILAFQGDVLALADGDTVVVWWKEDNRKIIRLIAVFDIAFDVRATAEVRDASGTLMPPPPEPPVRWHESFRYFRISQTTVDLYDAYRNLYLALEAILSSITPSLKPTGGKKRETDWLDEALTAAQKFVDLSLYAADRANPLPSLKQELYEYQRTHVFHAKLDRPVHLPQDPATRLSVGQSLNRLGRLYIDLASKYVNVRRGSGGIMIGGVDLASAALPNLSMDASDDRSVIDRSTSRIRDTVTLVPLTVRAAPEISEPFLRYCVGTIAAVELSSLPHVARVFWGENRKPYFIATVPGDLHTGGADRFEAQLGIRFGSARYLRTRYSH